MAGTVRCSPLALKTARSPRRQQRPQGCRRVALYASPPAVGRGCVNKLLVFAIATLLAVILYESITRCWIGGQCNQEHGGDQRLGF